MSKYHTVRISEKVHHRYGGPHYKVFIECSAKEQTAYFDKKEDAVKWAEMKAQELGIMLNKEIITEKDC